MHKDKVDRYKMISFAFAFDVFYIFDVMNMVN